MNKRRQRSRGVLKGEKMSTNKLSRDYLVDLVVNKYFVNVDRHNMQSVLDCFTSDAIFTIQSAFTDHEGRDTGIRKMFETFFATYKTSVHKDSSRAGR